MHVTIISGKHLDPLLRSLHTIFQWKIDNIPFPFTLLLGNNRQQYKSLPGGYIPRVEKERGMLEVPWLAVELREWFASHRLTFPCSSLKTNEMKHKRRRKIHWQIVYWFPKRKRKKRNKCWFKDKKESILSAISSVVIVGSHNRFPSQRLLKLP